MAKKIRRPNRIIKLPRVLYQLMDEISYFQAEEISCNDFIIEILEEIGRDYGELMQETAVKYRGSIVKRYSERSNFLRNPEDNNRFFQDVRI